MQGKFHDILNGRTDGYWKLWTTQMLCLNGIASNLADAAQYLVDTLNLKLFSSKSSTLSDEASEFDSVTLVSTLGMPLL